MRMNVWRTVCAVLALGIFARPGFGQVSTPLTPVPTAYYPVQLDFDSGLGLDEAGTNPNPFLDYRLGVTFTAPDGDTFDIAGFYAGDGNGNGSGGVFRVLFSPDEPGVWSWSASFRSGSEVAIDLSPTAGMPVAPVDGQSGMFTAAAPAPSAPGFFAKGRLDYVGEHYLRFQDGSYYVKGGVDSPENWLGYIGFDNTQDFGGLDAPTPSDLHEFLTHVADWNPGDPDWDSPDTTNPNDGRAIIGALNYLASTDVNSIYFLPMNLGGDAQDTHPWIDVADPDLNYDVSKLAQWDIFFTHAQRLGIFLHFVLNEAESGNKNRLDNAQLGTERRLFYREMNARFGWHNAMQWNVSEEYNLNLNLGEARVREFAESIRSFDGVAHPITVHNAGNAGPNGALNFIIGDPRFDLPSIQQARRISGWGGVVEDWRDATTNAGRPLPVMIDEPGSPTRDFNNNFDDFRKFVIWPILMSGGGGEWFINNRDQSLEDFREFDKIWRETGFAVRVFEDELPFWRMSPRDELAIGASSSFDGPEVFAAQGEVYAIYLPQADQPTQGIDLTEAPGVATVRWFNPRTGAFEGGFSGDAGGVLTLGVPPSSAGEDWLAIVEVEPIMDGRFALTVINGEGSGRFLPGETVMISAMLPPDATFTGWTGFPVADAQALSTTLVMPSQAVTVTATFELPPPPDGLIIAGMTLVNTTSDAPLVPVADGDVVALDQLPCSPAASDLGLIATVGNEVSSMAFSRGGGVVQTESMAPYSLSGDSSGDFNALSPPFVLGDNTVTATPFSGSGGSGNQGTALTVTFRLVASDLGVADYDGNGVINISDLFAYINAFTAGDAASEVDGNGVLNISDLFFFIGVFTSAGGG